jgi:hypothetical protein
MTRPNLAFLMMLAPKEVVRLLTARVAALAAQLAAIEASTAGALASGLPRLFFVEDEYRQAMLRAEIAWVGGLIEDLTTKRLTWSQEWIRKVAAAMAKNG